MTMTVQQNQCNSHPVLSTTYLAYLDGLQRLHLGKDELLDQMGFCHGDLSQAVKINKLSCQLFNEFPTLRSFLPRHLPSSYVPGQLSWLEQANSRVCKLQMFGIGMRLQLPLDSFPFVHYSLWPKREGGPWSPGGLVSALPASK